MKLSLLGLISILSFVISACNRSTIEYQPAEPLGSGIYYKIKYDGDTRKMGLGYLYDKTMIIPCEYDSIRLFDSCLPGFYIAQKDDIRDIFYENGKNRYLGFNINSLDSIPDNSIDSNSYLDRKLYRLGVDDSYVYFYVLYLPKDDKYHFFSCGPYDNFVEGYGGYFYKKNGLWGFASISPECEDSIDGFYTDYNTILDASADSIIQLLYNETEQIWLSLVKNEWIYFDTDGNRYKAPDEDVKNILCKSKMVKPVCVLKVIRGKD